MIIIVAFFLLLTITITIINGQTFTHPLTNMPPPSNAVTTSYYFHNQPDPQSPKLPIGEFGKYFYLLFFFIIIIIIINYNYF